MARIVVNGVWENDLEQESLDDMMRAAVELGDLDICLLKELYERPYDARRPFNTYMDMNEIDKGRTDVDERMGSVAKLQSVAFVQLRTPGFDMGASLVILLPKGRRFYERLQEIGSTT